MIGFVLANLATIIVTLILVVIVALIIMYIIKLRKKGRSFCSSGCVGCPMEGKCHKQEIEKQNEENKK